ncbi:hypothetical protein C8R44DRAFT_980626 [Mycena epipterygia]|nr:hypothetical protein C8R44DRAFT_980626 [Mycena epipterygia]
MHRPGTGPQLPSIRTLHPYLPPPLAPGQYSPPSTNPVAPSASSCAGFDPEVRDAEPEGDPEEPPKKRRRQALSCTECKRRKIREKYVPRAEHDVLLARVAALEAYLQRIPPPAPGALPPLNPVHAIGSSSSSNNAHGNASPPRFINPSNNVNPSHLGYHNTFTFNPSNSPPMHGLMSFSPQWTSAPQTLASTQQQLQDQRTSSQPVRPRTNSGASLSQLQTRSISPHQTRRSLPELLESPSTDETQTQHRDQQQRRASFSQPLHRHTRPRTSSSASLSQLQTRAISPQTRRSPPQILALESASTSTSTHQRPQRRASFSPRGSTPTSTQPWGVGGGGGFGVFPAAPGASGSGSAASFFASPGSGSGAGGASHTPASSGSFFSFSASPGGSSSFSSFSSSSASFSAGGSSISSTASRSAASASSFSSSDASATPVPLMSSARAESGFTPGVQMRAKCRIQEIYDSPLTLVSTATASVNTSVEALVPKNRPAQAPQRLRAGVHALDGDHGLHAGGLNARAGGAGGDEYNDERARRGGDRAGRGAGEGSDEGGGQGSGRLLLDVNRHPSPPLRAPPTIDLSAAPDVRSLSYLSIHFPLSATSPRQSTSSDHRRPTSSSVPSFVRVRFGFDGVLPLALVCSCLRVYLRTRKWEWRVGGGRGAGGVQPRW